MAIILPGGFSITNNEPVDARISVSDATARLAFSIANVYEGLIVYQKDTDQLYVLNDSTTPGTSSSWSLISSQISGSVMTGVTGGLGLSGGGNSGSVVITLDTGSTHFTDAISNLMESGIFTATGSIYSTTNDLEVTGSLILNYNGISDPFNITSASIEVFKVDKNGVLTLTSQSNVPNPVSGGIYFGGDGHFYVGV